MNRPPAVATVLLLLACRLGPVVAQADAAPVPDLGAKVQQAIADHEAVKGDGKREAQQRRTLLWLGEIAHAEATAYLQQQLAAAADKPFAAVVCEAIAKVPRPELQAPLLVTLQLPNASVAVRDAAATAVAKLGAPGIEALLPLLAAADEQVKPATKRAVRGALIDSRDERAFRVLLPQLTAEGPVPPRLELLRRMEAVHDVTALESVRAKLLREAPLELAACAWRQLAVGKPARARDLAVDMIERVTETPRAAVAADLIGGLVRVRDADYYPLLLRYGSDGAEVVRKALREAAVAAAEDPALLRWLVQKGLDDDKPSAREAAKLLLQAAPAEFVKPLVDRVRTDLRAGKKKALDQAAGLHELLAKDPTWRLDLATMTQSSDVETRMLGLALLLEIGADDGILVAQECLDHKAWELRSLAIRYLTRCRDVNSIPLLIARYGREEGRLASELDQALFAHTGTRHWKRRAWEQWWEKAQTGFTLPHPDTVKHQVASGGGKTVSYHDIPVVSQRICFLVDRSGSMKEPMGGTDKKRTRLDAAKEQLVRVIEALPATTWVNLIAYETGVQPFWDEVRKLDDEARKDLLKMAKLIPLGAGTNIFDALEAAFHDPKVDTVYLMTDGQPSVGRLTDADEIVEEVVRWNRTRQVVVHCIGLGLDSGLLKRLAAATGGSYKFVR